MITGLDFRNQTPIHATKVWTQFKSCKLFWQVYSFKKVSMLFPFRKDLECSLSCQYPQCFSSSFLLLCTVGVRSLEQLKTTRFARACVCVLLFVWDCEALFFCLTLSKGFNIQLRLKESGQAAPYLVLTTQDSKRDRPRATQTT